MNETSRLAVFIDLGSKVVTAVAAVLILWQVFIAERAVVAQTWQLITQEQVEISKVFVEHSDLRPYFYEKKALIPDDPKRQAVLAVADMYLDFIDGLEDDYIYHLPNMGKGGSDRILWDRFFAKSFSLSPVLCVRYGELRDVYRESIARHTKPGCEPSTRTSNPAVHTDATR
jgi:hypothetical protein